MRAETAVNLLLLRRFLVATSCAILALIPIFTHENSSKFDFLALKLAAAFLLFYGVYSLVVDRRRRARHAAETSAADVPDWCASLPDPMYRDLESRFVEYERRVRRAEQSQADYQRRSTRSLNSAWELVASSVNSEERARGRIVADLHDTVVQQIIGTTWLAEEEDTPREVLSEQLRDAERQLRDLMLTARPPDLRRGDLGAAASNLSRIAHRRHGLDVSWDWPEVDFDLPEAVAVTLYRFWQEGLSNVAKHAQTTSAMAGLGVGADIEAWVADDGAGFTPSPDAVDSSGEHIGIGLMRERASQIGARISVDSRPGRGTRLVLTMPVPPAGVDRPVPIGQGPDMHTAAH